METQTTSFTVLLKEELNRRQRKNPGYSMRAFSKSLKLSSSFVSKVLNGQKNISPKKMLSLASMLNADQDAVEEMITRSPSYKVDNIKFAALAVDQFEYIADWHHFAILEAISLQDFESNPKWFAQRFGITEARADQAIKRLLRLGLLKIDKKGNLSDDVQHRTTIGASVPSTANTEHERQLLQKAIEALDEIPKTERSQTSMTMSIPSSRFKEAREKILTFQREMAAFLQRKGKRDSVYQLSISFYPLTIQQSNQQSKQQTKTTT